MIVPPGGAAAFNQQTPAAKAGMGLLRAATSAAKRTVRRKARATGRKVGVKARKKSGRKLKFGSPAWRKKYMKAKKR